MKLDELQAEKTRLIQRLVSLGLSISELEKNRAVARQDFLNCQEARRGKANKNKHCHINALNGYLEAWETAISNHDNALKQEKTTKETLSNVNSEIERINEQMKINSQSTPEYQELLLNEQSEIAQLQLKTNSEIEKAKLESEAKRKRNRIILICVISITFIISTILLIFKFRRKTNK